MTAKEARAMGYQVPEDVPNEAVLVSTRVELVSEGGSPDQDLANLRTSYRWTWTMVYDTVTENGEPWPYRTKCERCDAWLGLQNPGTVCDTCKTRPDLVA